MKALLHKLCLDAFYRYIAWPCLEVSVRQRHFPLQAPGLKDSPSAKSVDDRHKAWRSGCPRTRPRCGTGSPPSTDEPSRCFAHCASFGVNALYEKIDRYGAGVSPLAVGGSSQADRLARAVDLDMVEAGWRPTVENYLGRVPKRRILEAVREGAGERAAQLIDHLKKADMAKEAERLLADTGWLPEPLRMADVETRRRRPEARRRWRSPAGIPRRRRRGSPPTSRDEPQMIAAE